MKEAYVVPEVEILKFEDKDIILTSLGENELPFVPTSF